MTENLTMDETPKKVNLHVSDDGMAILLDCDVSLDNLGPIIEEINKELEGLGGIEQPPSNEKLERILRFAARKDTHLVNCIILKDKSPQQPETEEVPEYFNLQVSEDKMAVMLDCDVTLDELDTLITDIYKRLKSLGFKKSLAKERLERVLRFLTRNNTNLVDCVIIKGHPPKPPKHGRCEWDGDFFNTGFVVDEKTGKIDYRQRAAQESITSGKLIGRQIPVEEGKDGMDVFRKIIPAEKPIIYYPKTGDGVRFSSSENAYYAERNGRVRLVNDILTVDELYVIEEDIDVSTGNITHNGAVKVKRDVLKGAKVQTTGNIEVNGVIEGADIHANGNLVVNGGITQGGESQIVVAGSINTKYILEGNVQAKKDITVEKQIDESIVKTLGAVIIPRGRIVGGEVTALRGIFVGQASTARANTHTMLTAGDNFGLENLLKLKRNRVKKIEDELSKLQSEAESFVSRQESASESEHEEYAKTLDNISKLEGDLSKINDEVEKTRAKEMDRAKQLIVVEKKLYPKTIICLGSKKLLIEKEYSGPLKAELVNGEIKLLNKSDNKEIEL